MELKISPPVGVFYINGYSMKHDLEFTVHKFSEKRRDVTKSPLFRLGDDVDEYEACIVWVQRDNTYSVYIEFLPEYHEKIFGHVEFHYMKGDGSNKSKTWLGNCTMKKDTLREFGWGVVHQNGLSPLRIEQSLTIFCEVYFSTSNNIDARGTKVVSAHLSKDMGILLSSEELSDITFKVGDKELKAHKNILSSRSPVFNSMFKSDMSEVQMSTVKITDIDYEVLQSVLVYIYTDNLTNVDTLAEEMLAAAEKYQLDYLKTECEELLCKNITVENAAHLFILAELHQANQLRSTAIEFINRCKQAVSKTEGMRLAKEQYPQLLLAAFV